MLVENIGECVVSIVRLLVKSVYQTKMTKSREPQQYGVLFEEHQIIGEAG